MSVQVPHQAHPEKSLPVNVALTGEGLAGREQRILLDVYKPKSDNVSLTLEKKIKFNAEDPPRAEAQFQIDPAELGEREERKDAGPALRDFCG